MYKYYYRVSMKVDSLVSPATFTLSAFLPLTICGSAFMALNVSNVGVFTS